MLCKLIFALVFVAVFATFGQALTFPGALGYPGSVSSVSHVAHGAPYPGYGAFNPMACPYLRWLAKRMLYPYVGY